MRTTKGGLSFARAECVLVERKMRTPRKPNYLRNCPRQKPNVLSIATEMPPPSCRLRKAEMVHADSPHSPQHLAVPEKCLNRRRTQTKATIPVCAIFGSVSNHQPVQVARSEQQRSCKERHITSKHCLHLRSKVEIASGAGEGGGQPSE